MNQSQNEKYHSYIEDSSANLETQHDLPDFAELRDRYKERQIKSQQSYLLSTSKKSMKVKTLGDSRGGFKFSRDERFQKSNPACLSFSIIHIPTTFSNKSCTFGYGKREPISKIILKRSEINPSPDKYSTRKSLPNNGCTFSSSRQSQIYRFVPHRRDPYSPHFSQNNADFSYTIRQEIPKRPITMSKKLKMFTEMMTDQFACVPGPGYNIDQRRLSNIGGYERGASIKTGKKMDLSKPLNQNPGPQYSLSDFCDKFTKLKEKGLINKKASRKRSEIVKQHVKTTVF